MNIIIISCSLIVSLSNVNCCTMGSICIFSCGCDSISDSDSNSDSNSDSELQSESDFGVDLFFLIW